jgi:hypothetical protein
MGGEATVSADVLSRSVAEAVAEVEGVDALVDGHLRLHHGVAS